MVTPGPAYRGAMRLFSAVLPAALTMRRAALAGGRCVLASLILCLVILGSSLHKPAEAAPVVTTFAPNVWGFGLAALPEGAVLFADQNNHRIVRIAPNGSLTTVAGNGTEGFSGDGGKATEAQLKSPHDVALTSDGGFLIADRINFRVRKVVNGTITTLASNLQTPYGISPTADGGVLIADGCCSDRGGPVVRKVKPDSSMTTVAGFASAGCGPTNHGDGGAALNAHLCNPWSVIETSPGDFIFSDSTLRTVNSGVITSLAPMITSARGISRAPNGDILFVDKTRVWRLVNGSPQLIAGTGAEKTDCDGAPARNASFENLVDVSQAADGAIYVLDAGRVPGIRKIAEGPVTVAPIANIAGPEHVLAGSPVTFDARGSKFPCDLSPGQHEWDLDGDGSFETTTGAEATVRTTFEGVRSLKPRVRITNAGGVTSIAETTVHVRSPSPSGPVGISINNGARFVNQPDVTLTVRWPLYATDLLASNDGGFANAIQAAVTASLPWRLDSSGPERLPKTVYVRFTGGQSGPETYQDDIILDETPPLITEALSEPMTDPSGARIAQQSQYTIKVKAVDEVSGVKQMQFATVNAGTPGALQPYRETVTLESVPRYVRVSDTAGNYSSWREIVVPSTRPLEPSTPSLEPSTPSLKPSTPSSPSKASVNLLQRAVRRGRSLRIRYSSPTAERLTVKLVRQGRAIRTRRFKIASGSGTVVLTTKGMRRGRYEARVSLRGSVRRFQFRIR